MPTNIISPTTRISPFLCRISNFCRNKKESIDMLREKHYGVIKERKLNRNTSVFLGYKNEYISYANMAILVSRDGTKEIKYSDSKSSPLPTSVRRFNMRKDITKKNGDKEYYERSTLFNPNGIITKNTEHKQEVIKGKLEQENISEYSQFNSDKNTRLTPSYLDYETYEKIVRDNFGENAHIIEIVESMQYDKVNLHLKSADGKILNTTCPLRFIKVY